MKRNPIPEPKHRDEPWPDRYLRHIRNYVAWAFWLWLVDSILGF